MKELEDKVARRIEAAIQGYSARTGNRLSWASLAREIGYTSQAPTKWKKGAINYKVIEKIAEFLGADPVWLTYGSPNEDKILKTVGIGKSRFTNPHINGFDPSFNPIEKEAEFLKNFEEVYRQNIALESFNQLDSLAADHIFPNSKIKNKEDFLNNIIILDNNEHRRLAGVKLVPVISYVQAGSFKEAIQDAQENFVASYAENLSKNAFALEVQGESMSPEFKPGDKIVVDPEVEPKPGDYVIAQNGEHEATFKMYKPRGFDDQGREYFELTPLNQMYPTLDSRFQRIEIIGTVVEHVRSLKRLIN